MSDFGGMEELLQDFLTEAGDLLSDVDNKLVELERQPDNRELLNDIFRGFHTIKGGAGFLNVHEMVALCHRTENLFDKLRNGEMQLNAEIMDTMMSATATVRGMFSALTQTQMPAPADPALLQALDDALSGNPVAAKSAPKAVVVAEAPPSTASGNEPNWPQLYQAVTGQTETVEHAHVETVETTSQPVSITASHPAPHANLAVEAARPSALRPPQQQAAAPVAKETTIRVDTVRLDQVLNLSGEIGLTKNRLNCLRADILAGKHDAGTYKALDDAVNQLDLLVGDLQNAVMKTRMQPIGRLFQKYPRLARDLARQLGKDVELVLSGEETELDKTMIEDLNDPLVHLVRNAVDHGIEDADERQASGKPMKSLVRLTATQVGDHIIIEISDDGRGMRPDVIRRKAIEKGIIDAEMANTLDDRQSMHLIFLPGFSTKDEISSISGRGVGMDVVKTNIQRMNGRIEVNSIVGEGTTFTISLPLTLAILPVLVVRVGTQPFAVPLSLVREIIPIERSQVQQISGRATMVVRDEVLPIRSLASLIGWHETTVPAFGVLMQSADTSFILAIDAFVGRDDVVIKPLSEIKPMGIAGATLSGDGQVVLVLDMEELLRNCSIETRAALFLRSA